jgi:transposase
VFDLPPTKIEATAHESEIKCCPSCGTTTQADFPTDVQGQAVQYGPRIQAFSVYLTQGQMLPYERASELIEGIWGHWISPGTQRLWTQAASEQLASLEQDVHQAICETKGPVHFDETGCRAVQERQWLHSASTEKLTFYAINRYRGGKAMDAIGILPEFRGKAVHDHWGAYFRYEDCAHVLCNSHVLRELTFVHEEHEERWAKKMKSLLKSMNDAVHQARLRGQRRFYGPTLESYRKSYDRIVQTGLRFHARKRALAPPPARGRTRQRAGKNLLDRLKKRSDAVLGFLYDFEIPFTNNLAERDIRMMKVKQKISGCFRSQQGARDFCRIRGYLSTACKQRWNLLESLESVFVGAPHRPVLV